MKSFNFPFTIASGKLDQTENSFTHALSDVKAKRLERSAKDGGMVRLNDDSDIEDIYDEVYYAIIKAEEKALRADPSIVAEGLCCDEDYNPTKRITRKQILEYLDELDIVIYYPVELQNLPRTTPRQKKQKVYRSNVEWRKVTLHVISGSKAEAFAKKRKIKYKHDLEPYGKTERKQQTPTEGDL